MRGLRVVAAGIALAVMAATTTSAQQRLNPESFRSSPPWHVVNTHVSKRRSQRAVFQYIQACAIVFKVNRKLTWWMDMQY